MIRSLVIFPLMSAYFITTPNKGLVKKCSTQLHADWYVPEDFTPCSNYDLPGDGELQWPGLDDIDEEIEFLCKDKYGSVAETIDDCEIVDEDDIKTFVSKYNEQWIRYYENFPGSPEGQA